MRWTANIRLILTPTHEDRHAVWVHVAPTMEGVTVGEMRDSAALKHRRLVHIKHAMSEALGRLSLQWGSLLKDRPWAKYHRPDDA